MHAEHADAARLNGQSGRGPAGRENTARDRATSTRCPYWKRSASRSPDPDRVYGDVSVEIVLVIATTTWLAASRVIMSSSGDGCMSPPSS